MSWSVTVVDPGGITVPNPFTAFQEEWARDNPAYPIDADLAYALAKQLGLKGATLSGGRTPVIGGEGDEEIVVVTITGSSKSLDFLNLMHHLVTRGPDLDTPVAKHYLALEKLRQHPCQHEFHDNMCWLCGVRYEGGLFSIEPD